MVKEFLPVVSPVRGLVGGASHFRCPIIMWQREVSLPLRILEGVPHFLIAFSRQEMLSCFYERVLVHRAWILWGSPWTNSIKHITCFPFGNQWQAETQDTSNTRSVWLLISSLSLSLAGRLVLTRFLMSSYSWSNHASHLTSLCSPVACLPPTSSLGHQSIITKFFSGASSVRRILMDCFRFPPMVLQSDLDHFLRMSLGSVLVPSLWLMIRQGHVHPLPLPFDLAVVASPTPSHSTPTSNDI